MAAPTIPHYYQIRTLLLIVTVLEDWEEADSYLKQATTIYTEANRLTSETDEEAQSSLRQVREDLNQLM